jgi:YVTN family beta-propeller protein
LTGRIEKTIDLPSMAFGMTLSSDKRYILMPNPAKGEVFVADTHSNEFIKTVKVGKLPSSIISPGKMNKAFVANRLSSSISEIDLTNMQVKREIPVTGYPQNILITDNKDFLFYTDSRSGKIYQLNLETGLSWELFEVKNVSKISWFGKYLLTLSRSKDILTVFDREKGEIIKEVTTGKKPLDLAVAHHIGRILVVCAESDEIDIIDVENFEVIKKVPLDSGGFPGEIRLVDEGSMALITNYDAYEIIIYNVDAERVQGKLPVSRAVNQVVVSDK